MSELRNLGLRQLEWDKSPNDGAQVAWNNSVDRHNREIAAAFRAGIAAGLGDVESDEYHAVHYSSVCLWGEGERCRAASQAIRMIIDRRKKRLLPQIITPEGATQ